MLVNAVGKARTDRGTFERGARRRRNFAARDPNPTARARIYLRSHGLAFPFVHCDYDYGLSGISHRSAERLDGRGVPGASIGRSRPVRFVRIVHSNLARFHHRDSTGAGTRRKLT